MATADSCDASGGRCTFTANGVIWSLRSAVKIMPQSFEREAVSNQDGSLAIWTKPVPAEAEITLSDRSGLVLEDLLVCPLDVTIDLIDVHRRYLFTGAIIIGRPSLNSENGEISGFKVTSALVKPINY